MNTKVFHTAVLLLRIALAAAFASAVADRFGIWGQPGANGVSWGDLSHFNAYVAKLNWVSACCNHPRAVLDNYGA